MVVWAIARPRSAIISTKSHRLSLNRRYQRAQNDDVVVEVSASKRFVQVLPVLGKGSLQNLADILYLRGIDVGIVQSNVPAYAKQHIQA